MAIVSISEASRLTGKTRATIHRHINTGKLSGSVALRNSKPVFQLGLSISQPKSKR